MNKKLLTLAVAGTLVAPAIASADASWYGSIRNSIMISDPDGGSTNVDIKDHSSRIGVKGAQDLGNGLKVPYRFELKMDSDSSSGVESGRLGRIGLAGGFGAIHIGQLWGPYYNYMGANDIFNTAGYSFYRGNFRLSNAIRYDMPSTGGFSGQIALITDGADGEDVVDGFQVGLGFKTDMFGVNLAYNGDQVNDDNDTFGLALYGSFGGADLGLTYEDSDASGDATHVVAAFNNGPNVYRVGFATADEGDAFTLGWQHKLGKKSRVAVEFQTTDLDAGGDSNQLAFFIRTDF